jgi:hypothetical protein
MRSCRRVHVNNSSNCSRSRSDSWSYQTRLSMPGSWPKPSAWRSPCGCCSTHVNKSHALLNQLDLRDKLTWVASAGMPDPKALGTTLGLVQMGIDIGNGEGKYRAPLGERPQASKPACTDKQRAAAHTAASTHAHTHSAGVVHTASSTRTHLCRWGNCPMFSARVGRTIRLEAALGRLRRRKGHHT